MSIRPEDRGRRRSMRSRPLLKRAVSTGIGLFIAYIGLKNAGIIVSDPSGTVSALNAEWFTGAPGVAMIGLLIITINPVGAHAIAKGAYRSGIRPDKEMEIDDYGRDFNE